MSRVATFRCQKPWDSDRPHLLVVACSDGRLQANVDEFLNESLQIEYYDRLFLPGGPGALASSGDELVRSAMHRQELLFLIRAHQLQRIVLLFHGPAPDGPASAVCADYHRSLRGASPEVIARQQEADFREVAAVIERENSQTSVVGFRCEVTATESIEFVRI